MDCRILRQLMLKSDGHLVCDDSNGYFLTLGEVSKAHGWSISQVLGGGVYSHVRSSFRKGSVPWSGICETCDLFSAGGFPNDTLQSKISIMVEPTLRCHLACPTCKRVQEGNRRSGTWDLDLEVFEVLLASCAAAGIEVESIHYLGWGEPLLHSRFGDLTRLARRLAPNAVQDVTTTGNVALHEGLRNLDVDRLIVSCDGVTPKSYEKFRRKGDLNKVLSFLRLAQTFFDNKPFIEWKYIVFEHNSSDDELAAAEALAQEIGVDALLFILTNSKGAAARFSVQNIANFPMRGQGTAVMPAAALMKTRYTAKMIAHDCGDRVLATLYIDRCTLSESNILVVEGWALASDGRYVNFIDLMLRNEPIARVKTIHKRFDVVRSKPDAEGPGCGFLIRVPVGDLSEFSKIRLVANTRSGEEAFEAELSFQTCRADSAETVVAPALARLESAAMTPSLMN